MTPRERVERCLIFENPDRPPRQLWTLPIALLDHPGAHEGIVGRWPEDIGYPAHAAPVGKRRVGVWTEPGRYVDDWGCEFENIQAGVIGEVKNPQLSDWSKLSEIKTPWEMVPGAEQIAQINESCAQSDRFMMLPVNPLFEQMQFLRGTENLFMDIMERPRELYELRDKVHEFNMAVARELVESDIDAISQNDDWGTQQALLIPPRLWREIFRPCYAELVQMVKAAGKRFFLHSDGHIFEIYEDLIEIGVDAVNSQLFCMDIEEIGKRYKGAITFWGEIDRQHVLPSPDPEVARAAVRRVVDALHEPVGGVIAQCEFGPGANPACVEAVFEEWDALTG